MSLINDITSRQIRARGQDPHLRPIIDRVEAAQHDGATSSEVIAVALKATRDQYLREQRTPGARTLRADAYLAATVGAVERPYQLQDLPTGSDKTMHFFMSAGLAAGMERQLADWYVPAPVARGVAIGLTTGLGFLKEVADLFTSGFNRDDLRADTMGARRPFSP